MYAGKISIIASPEGAEFEYFFGNAKGKRVYSLYGKDSLNFFGTFFSVKQIKSFVSSFRIAEIAK